MAERSFEHDDFVRAGGVVSGFGVLSELNRRRSTRPAAPLRSSRIRAGLPGRDVDQLEAEFLFQQINHLLS